MDTRVDETRLLELRISLVNVLEEEVSCCGISGRSLGRLRMHLWILNSLGTL